MARPASTGDIVTMEISRRQLHNWTGLRLELAETPEFPNGSPSRALLLRLPFDAAGLLDRDAAGAHPRLAMFRRFWTNEPDARGYIAVADGQLHLIANDPARSVIGRLVFEGERIEVDVVAWLEWAGGPALPLRIVSLDLSAG